MFSFIDIRIGWWRINQNNVIQLLVSVTTFIIFIVSWFVIIDLSKELELIKAKQEKELIESTDSRSAEENESIELPELQRCQNIETKDQDKCPEENQNNKSCEENKEIKSKRKLMKWRELFLCVSVSQ